MRITLDLKKSIEQNASAHYDRAKKLRKKVEGAKAAIATHETKLAKLLKKDEKAVASLKRAAPRKKEWYEKFRWLYASNGMLVIGGRDATTNEMVIKKHTERHDIVFHTDMAGSPFFVVKTEGKKVSDAVLREVANATLVYSRAFSTGLRTTPVFWVTPEQVTKEAQSGEYLTKGAFMIRGTTHYIDNEVSVAIGVLSDGRLMCGPEASVTAHCTEMIRLEQGDEKPSAIAKKIHKRLGGDLDTIIRILPSGGLRLRKA